MDGHDGTNRRFSQFCEGTKKGRALMPAEALLMECNWPLYLCEYSILYYICNNACVKCHHLCFFIFGLVICLKWRRPSPANSFLFHGDEFLEPISAAHQLFSGNKLRRIRWTVHMERMEEWVGAYIVLLGKPRRKRQFGRTRGRWEDYIDLAQDWERWRAVVNAVI